MVKDESHNDEKRQRFLNSINRGPEKFRFVKDAYQNDSDAETPQEIGKSKCGKKHQGPPKNLGYMNGWDRNQNNPKSGGKGKTGKRVNPKDAFKNYPKEYVHCQVRKRKNKHLLDSESVGRPGRGHTKYTCTKCNIVWFVDSSD
jgi:hypothetical protein